VEDCREEMYRGLIEGDVWRTCRKEMCRGLNEDDVWRTVERKCVKA
jgi:hypothetical protein